MPELRNGPSGLTIKQDLAGRAGNEVVAADHLVHAHGRIIGNDRKLIRVAGLVSRDDEVSTQPGGVKCDSAQTEVVPFDQARRHAKSPGEWTIAQGYRISDTSIGTGPGIGGPLIVDVRCRRRAGNIGPSASAGVDAFGFLEDFERLLVK